MLRKPIRYPVFNSVQKFSHKLCSSNLDNNKSPLKNLIKPKPTKKIYHDFDKKPSKLLGLSIIGITLMTGGILGLIMENRYMILVFDYIGIMIGFIFL